MKSIIGNWKLIFHSQLDSNIQGDLIYFDDFRMSVNLSGLKDNQIITLEYSGSFKLEDNYIDHIISDSNILRLINTTQRRYFTIDNNLLTLTDHAIKCDFKAIWQKL